MKFSSFVSQEFEAFRNVREGILEEARGLKPARSLNTIDSSDFNFGRPPYFVDDGEMSYGILVEDGGIVRLPYAFALTEEMVEGRDENSAYFNTISAKAPTGMLRLIPARLDIVQQLVETPLLDTYDEFEAWRRFDSAFVDANLENTQAVMRAVLLTICMVYQSAEMSDEKAGFADIQESLLELTKDGSGISQLIGLSLSSLGEDTDPGLFEVKIDEIGECPVLSIKYRNFKECMSDIEDEVRTAVSEYLSDILEDEAAVDSVVDAIVPTVSELDSGDHVSVPLEFNGDVRLRILIERS